MINPPEYMVLEELQDIADEIDTDDYEEAMMLAMYSLGFGDYNGFDE